VLPDGSYFIIENTGANGSALQLFASYNQGATWTSVFTFPNTVGGVSSTNGTVSTDDVIVGTTLGNTTELLVAYDQDPVSGGTNIPKLIFTVLNYNKSTHVWAEKNGFPQAVASSPTSCTLYQEPSIGVDSNANLWVASVNKPLISGCIIENLHVYYSVLGSGSWTDTSLPFANGTPAACPGTGTGTYPNHAGQLVHISSTIGTIGFLYQNGLCLFWQTIAESGTPPSATFTEGYTTGQPIGTSLPTDQKRDQDTAYSVVTDHNGNLYVGYATGDSSGNATGVYTTTFVGSSDTWTTPVELTGASNASGAAYVKATYLTESSASYVLMVVNSGDTLLTSDPPEDLTVYYAPDVAGGLGTYTQKYTLQIPEVVPSGVNFNNPRIEQPAYIITSQLLGTTFPVFEQYTSDSSGDQSLILYSVPATFP
jgi:hypothetical protein